MNEPTAQQLIFQSKRWPWKWFAIFSKAAAICEQEICKFTVLEKQHSLTLIEVTELRKQRLEDSQRIQELRDDQQLAKLQIGQLVQQLRQAEQQHIDDVERSKMLTVEVNSLRESNANLLETSSKLTNQLHNALDGTVTLWETIRRLKVVDSMGKMLPELPRNFRQ